MRMQVDLSNLADLDRCDREIRNARAALMEKADPETYVWYRDWQYEKKLLKQELSPPPIDNPTGSF